MVNLKTGRQKFNRHKGLSDSFELSALSLELSALSLEL